MRSLSLFVFVVTVSATAVYKAPEDCEWNAVRDEIAVRCKLRTVNGAFDNTNFSLIQAERTASLTVVCDDILFESYLMNRSFEHLKQLKELTIEKCKMRELPVFALSGLSNLNNLTIRTMNNEWGDLSLQIFPDSFASLQALQRVDLSKNSISVLPERLFCNLANLRFVNLSSNQFSEVVNIGFSTKNRETGNDSCRLDAFTHLDVSLNKIKVLTDRGFSMLSKLQVLSLRHNLISRAEESSLFALNRLSVLQLSNNQLVALPPRFFHPVQQSLTELHLENNSITVLPPGLFNGLQQLVLLDLSHNEITSNWIGVDTFSDLIRVTTIDLSFNRLSRIDGSTFRSQFHLQVLQLHHNEIESIADNAFSSLYNLQSLVLSHNRLSRIDGTCFAGLQALSSLALDNNKIDFVHIDAFRNISNLMELNVSANKLDAVPAAISALHSLRSLDLSYNLIENISNASYQGNEHLYGLNLEFNRIGNLSKGVFQDLPSLRILNLAKNKIRAIEQGTFDDVPDLHALRLDSNLIVDINGLFSNLRDLLMLNISANKIGWFDYALIPIGLQWLDIHDNRIDTLGNYFELESVLKLRTLDCSFNRLTDVESASLPDGIEIVFLNNNSITKVAPFAFMGKQNLTRIDLTNNRLQTLDTNAFRLNNVRLRKPLPEFSVSGNPYLCDCNMEWLQRIKSFDSTRQYPRIVDLEAVECQLPFSRQTLNIALTKANSSNFLCKYKSHCFALCHCCEFDACDCEMVCPENCTCYYDQTWDTNIVDCSRQAYTAIPQRIPMDVSELYLDGNDITTLTSHTFVGRKNLRILYLNNSNVHYISNRTFNGLQYLQVIHLEHNKLTALYGFEFDSLQNLQELHLHHNRISLINNNTFIYLKNLQVLHLENNAIVAFQIWNLNLNSKVSAVYLSQNLWTCKCEFMEKFQDWVQAFGNFVKDSDNVRCFYNKTTVGPYLREFNALNCSNVIVDQTSSSEDVSNKASFFRGDLLQDRLPLLIVAIITVILVLIVFICVCVHRKELQVWIYSKYGVRFFPKSRYAPECDKLFDAFVSYCKKDEAFIAQILAPKLGCGHPPYRLYLRYRDLPVTGYVVEAITEAIASSHRTIIVLSEQFLKSEACRFELKVAHHECQVNKHHKLVVVLLDKCLNQLDSEAKQCLRSVPVIHWGDRRFWEKLRFALPPPGLRVDTRNVY